ncbi:Uncharacterized protein APZ42_021881 [Daphnia magna]|uniref:Uncharacterized protein n=1 Tax=Daphnia magna TaxID=35525 RepID=A0A164W9B5_9CRUS|nr:Uncharacterized protein APZ42_021881 [Daphnia magna]
MNLFLSRCALVSPAQSSRPSFTPPAACWPSRAFLSNCAVVSLRFALLFDFILLGHEIIKCPIVVRKELKEMTTKIVSIIEMNQFKTGSRCRIPFDVHYVRKRKIDSKEEEDSRAEFFVLKTGLMVVTVPE